LVFARDAERVRFRFIISERFGLRAFFRSSAPTNTFLNNYYRFVVVVCTFVIFLPVKKLTRYFPSSPSPPAQRFSKLENGRRRHENNKRPSPCCLLLYV